MTSQSFLPSCTRFVRKCDAKKIDPIDRYLVGPFSLLGGGVAVGTKLAQKQSVWRNAMAGGPLGGQLDVVGDMAIGAVAVGDSFGDAALRRIEIAKWQIVIEKAAIKPE